jgi:hypothetical protein
LQSTNIEQAAIIDSEAVSLTKYIFVLVLPLQKSHSVLASVSDNGYILSIVFAKADAPCVAGRLACEDCFGKYLAPDCEKCRKKITSVSHS